MQAGLAHSLRLISTMTSWHESRGKTSSLKIPDGIHLTETIMSFTFQPLGFVTSVWFSNPASPYVSPQVPIVLAWDDDDDDDDVLDDDEPEERDPDDPDGAPNPVVEEEEEEDPFQDFDENDFDDDFDDDFEEELEDDYEIEPDDSEMFPDADDNDPEIGEEDLDILDE